MWSSNWYDIYCIPDSEYPIGCPIMDVFFLDKNQALPESPHTPPIRVPFTSSLDLVYTKQNSNKGPLSFNKVGSRPCYDPS